MNETDQFLYAQVQPQLMPGEQILHTSTMRRQPGLLMQILLFGGLLLFLITKTYLVVLTNRRMILILTKAGFWSGKPQMLNLGVEQWDAGQLQQCTVSGFANNRSMTFHFRDGRKETLRISPWFKAVTGTAAFFEQVPALINGGQLAAGGAAGQMGAGAAAGQMAAIGMGAQPSPIGMSAPVSAPQLASGGAQSFASGQMVAVLWTDGNKYPAQVVQAQSGQYLCMMQNGQQHWVPASNVSQG
jgi:hypothetical protein